MRSHWSSGRAISGRARPVAIPGLELTLEASRRPRLRRPGAENPNRWVHRTSDGWGIAVNPATLATNLDGAFAVGMVSLARTWPFVPSLLEDAATAIDQYLGGRPSKGTRRCSARS